MTYQALRTWRQVEGLLAGWQVLNGQEKPRKAQSFTLTPPAAIRSLCGFQQITVAWTAHQSLDRQRLYNVTTEEAQ